MPARFMPSAVVPWFEAPSPKKQTVTWSVPFTLAVSPAPHASGGPPPTIPLAPSMPLSTSAMCMEPPLPLQAPVARP